jgi:hypothetical protein
MRDPVSTEGRVFVAQLTCDLAKREAAGAALLHPGAKTWSEAFLAFAHQMAKEARGPIQAGKMFAAGITRLAKAQDDARACFVNGSHSGSRSGLFQCLTFERRQHPPTKKGNEGIAVQNYFCSLSRRGHIGITRDDTVAFLSWHALGRMRERMNIDLFDGFGVVVGCGLAGVIMRESASISTRRSTTRSRSWCAPAACAPTRTREATCVTVSLT